MIKSRENISEYNSHSPLELVKFNHLSPQKHLKLDTNHICF